MKKNRFLTVVFSCIPGAGHMYLGYMKRGLQYLTLFCLSIGFVVMTGWTRLDFLVVFPIAAMAVVWLYAMFDSMHSLTRMRRDGVLFPEDDVFSLPLFKKPTLQRKYHKWIAVGLIVFGVLIFVNSTLLPALNRIDNQMMHEVAFFLSSYLAPTLLALALLFFGFRLLVASGRKPKEDDR